MIVAAALLALAAVDPVEVVVSVDADDRCKLTIGGETFDQERDSAGVRTALAALPRRRSLLVTASPSPDEVPWRCVGGAIYMLQGLGRKVGFIAEPPGE